MTGIAYERDYVSGEIVKYPFEYMDPMQIIEIYKKENNCIFQLTSNKNNKLPYKDII